VSKKAQKDETHINSNDASCANGGNVPANLEYAITLQQASQKLMKSTIRKTPFGHYGHTENH
jgi:hypothetical protein